MGFRFKATCILGLLISTSLLAVHCGRRGAPLPPWPQAIPKAELKTLFLARNTQGFMLRLDQKMTSQWVWQTTQTKNLFCQPEEDIVAGQTGQLQTNTTWPGWYSIPTTSSAASYIRFYDGPQTAPTTKQTRWLYGPAVTQPVSALHVTSVVTDIGQVELYPHGVSHVVVEEWLNNVWVFYGPRKTEPLRYGPYPPQTTVRFRLWPAQQIDRYYLLGDTPAILQVEVGR